MGSKEYALRRLCMFPSISYVCPRNAYRKGNPAFLSRVQTTKTCWKASVHFFFYLKAKTSLLCVRYECAYMYELKDNFIQLFQHIELESISKDSSDAAICMGCQFSNRRKDFLQWLPRREKTGNQATGNKQG